MNTIIVARQADILLASLSAYDRRRVLARLREFEDRARLMREPGTLAEVVA